MTALQQQCDELLRKVLAESRERCERCARHREPYGLDVAHIIRRRFAAVRCVESNVWALCRRCHRLVDNDKRAHAALVVRTIGLPELEKLTELAQAGPPLRGDQWWQQEKVRLRARLMEVRAA